jgi:hypothetical protein
MLVNNRKCNLLKRRRRPLQNAAGVLHDGHVALHGRTMPSDETSTLVNANFGQCDGGNANACRDCAQRRPPDNVCCRRGRLAITMQLAMTMQNVMMSGAVI